MQRLQNNLLVNVAAVSLKLTKMNTVSDNAVITKQSIIAYALIVRLKQVSRMTDLIISAIGLGICVAGIAFLILKGGGDG